MKLTESDHLAKPSRRSKSKPKTVSKLKQSRKKIRNSESALVASKQLLQDIIDHSTTLIYAVDLEGGFLVINRQLENKFGIKHQKLIDIFREEYLPAGIAAEHRANDLKVIESRQPITIEEENDEPDGKHTYLSVKFPLFDSENGIYGVGGISTDITEVKRTVEALQTGKENLESIFESSPVAMFILDETTNIVQINGAAVSMTGGNPSEALQHRLGNALRCIHSSKDPRGCGYSKVCKICNVRNGIEALIANGGTIHGAELALDLIRNGAPQKVWMSVGAEPIQLNGRRHVCVAMDDITERKRAEEALIDNELKYRALFETAADAILLFAEGKWVDCNAGALQVFGCNREQIIGAHPIKFSPSMQPDGRPSEEEAIKKINLAFAGESQHFEWEHCRLDGTPFSAEVSLNRLDLGGKPYMQAIVRDVSQRKQGEEALRASEQQHRTILETAMDGFWLVDMQGNLLEVNETYCRMSGYTEQELLTMQILDLESKESVNDTASHIQKIIEQGEDRFESRHRRKDGSFFKIEASVQYRAEEGGRFVVFMQDITERKRTEDALRQSERQQLLLLQSTDQGIYGIDQAGLCTFINSSAVQMIGYEPGEVIGRNMHVLIHHTRPDGSPYPIEECPIFNAFRIGSNVRITDEVLWRKDGSAFAVEYTSNPIREDENIIGAVVTFNDITERKQAEAHIQKQLRQIQALRNIDQAITSNLNLRVILNLLLVQVNSQLDVDATTVLLFDPSTAKLQMAAEYGFRSSTTMFTQQRLGEGYAGQAALERHIVHIPNILEAGGDLGRALILERESFVAYYGVPLITKGEVKGVLEVFHRSPLDPDPEWLVFLETMAGQAAIAIDDAQLFEKLQRSNNELAMAYEATIEGWSRAMDLRDKETEGHTQRVTEMTTKLAWTMGMSNEQIGHIRHGALLHDMGKLGVPDSILFKAGNLTDEECVIMHKHPQFAYDLLSSIEYLRPALDIPHYHHEKWDGTGYPQGLKGEQIPLSARLFAVVDVWDALRSDRPYRASWTHEKALEYIRAQEGTHFDPKAVELFMQVMSEEANKF